MEDTSIDFKNMPVYVINLDRRSDRWEIFAKQPVVKDFLGLERFSATDGKLLDEVHDSRISMHTRENIRRNIRRSHYEINTVGACGASFSHIGCWKKFLETEEPYCMIVEDDCLMTKEVFEDAKVLAKRIPKNFDIWILGYHRLSGLGKSYAPGSPWLLVDRFTGAHCYILTRKAAECLLKECFPIENHIEFYITNCARTNNLVFLKHSQFRVPQMVEETLENDSDTVSAASCPLCKVPTNPRDTWVLVPIRSLFHAGVAVAALGFVTYGYFKKMRCG